MVMSCSVLLRVARQQLLEEQQLQRLGLLLRAARQQRLELQLRAATRRRQRRHLHLHWLAHKHSQHQIDTNKWVDSHIGHALTSLLCM
jgi:hypothetical protein